MNPTTFQMNDSRVSQEGKMTWSLPQPQLTEQNTDSSLKPLERKGRELSGPFLLPSVIKQCGIAIQQRGNLGNVFLKSAFLIPTIRVLLRKKKGGLDTE